MALGDNAKKLLKLINLKIDGDTLKTINPEIDLEGAELVKKVLAQYTDDIIGTILGLIEGQLGGLTVADQKLHDIVSKILTAAAYKDQGAELEKLKQLVVNLSALQLRIILTKVDCKQIPKAEPLLLQLAEALNVKISELNKVHLTRLKQIQETAPEEALKVLPQAGGSSDMYKLKYLKYKAKYMGLRSRRRY